MRILIAALVITPLAGADSAVVQKGAHLVNHVALCTDCHSPRNEQGAFIEGKALQGSRLGFAPTVPMPAWATYAPPLVGLPTLTDEQALKLLTEGKLPTGKPLRPPMPQYRFTAEEALAVIAYLKSLDPEEK